MLKVNSLVSSGVTHLVVASELELDPVDIPVVSSRVTIVKVQVRSGRGHLVLEQHWMEYKASHPWVLLSHLPLPSSVCLQWFWESIQIDACADEMLGQGGLACEPILRP